MDLFHDKEKKKIIIVVFIDNTFDILIAYMT